MTIDEKLIAMRTEHPDWTMAQVAKALDYSYGYTALVSKRNGIGWREFQPINKFPQAQDKQESAVAVLEEPGSELSQWQARVISIVRGLERRNRRNKAERLEAGQLLWKIRDEMLKADPTVTRHGHPVAFYNWITKKVGIGRTTAYGWMYLAQHGEERSERKGESGVKGRWRFWRELHKRMKVTTSESERVALLIDAVAYLQRTYNIGTRVKVACERAA